MPQFEMDVILLYFILVKAPPTHTHWRGEIGGKARGVKPPRSDVLLFLTRGRSLSITPPFLLYYQNNLYKLI